MRTSCRFAMAVHVLGLLACQKGGVSSTWLAASVNTNPVIIRRLLKALQQANLVETRKGAGLGSRLRREAAAISLAEVYRAVDNQEPFALPHQKPSADCPFGAGLQVALAKVFVSAHAALERDLARTTLASLLQAAQPARVRLARATRKPF